MEYYTCEDVDAIIGLIKQYCFDKEKDIEIKNGKLINYDNYYILDLIDETLCSDRSKEIKRVEFNITQPLFPTKNKIDTLNVDVYDQYGDILLASIAIRKTIDCISNERKTEIMHRN